MVIKEGYKQTEIGLIPEDWEVKSYDEVFYFLNTAAYSRAELTELDEIKYIHYGDIHTKFNFHLDVNNSYLPSIPQSKLKNYSLLKDGDVIIADASEDYLGIGKSIEIKNLGDKKIISGLHTFLFRDKNDYFINGYKGYIHSINVVKKQFDSLATGMKVYGVSKNNLKKILIPIPTLAEQAAIATALSDADGLITALEKLIAKKRNIKQGAMQQLLQPKKGWEVKTLGEIADVATGTTPPTRDLDNYGVDFCFVSPADLGKVKYILNSEKKLSKKGFNISRKFPKNSILFTCIGSTIGKSAITKFELTSNQQINAIFPNNNYSSEYMFYYLNLISDDIKLSASEQAVPMINKTEFEKTSIILPPIEEQTRIATILSDMDAELSTLEEKLEKYKKIKLGMMQELLTGKTRLV